MQAPASHAGFPSDTNLLVDACIKRVREAARLDDDAVLPPLPVAMPRRDVVILTKDQIAGGSAGTSPGTEDGASGATRAGDDPRTSRANAATQVVSRRSVGTARWPLALCGFVAGAFACAAFLASPIGQRPDVKRVTHAAHVKAMDAGHGAAAQLSGLFR